MKTGIAIIVALALAPGLLGNGLAGERLEKVVGEFIVDVGTDQTSTPLAGQPIEFDFNLLQSETRDPVNLATSVGIDIGHNGKSMVNCDLVPELPMTFLYYTFPEGGDYTLTVSFFDSKRETARARDRQISDHDPRPSRKDSNALSPRYLGKHSRRAAGILLGNAQAQRQIAAPNANVGVAAIRSRPGCTRLCCPYGA